MYMGIPFRLTASPESRFSPVTMTTAEKDVDETGENDNNGGDNIVSLWEREESTLLTLHISDGLELLLRQYPSQDNRWGIHSSVWDGGIATLAFLEQQVTNANLSYNSNDRVCVLDLGSGTGIVGLGLAKLAPSWLRCVYLTDLESAMPLLHENIQFNHDAVDATGNTVPLSVQAVALDWLDDSESITNNDWWKHLNATATHLLLVGADIIYQPSLFQPLLTTIHRMKCKVASSPTVSSFRVLLGSHSIRSYHGEFWKQARDMGFQVQYQATVRVEMMTTTTAYSSRQTVSTFQETFNNETPGITCCPSNIQITIPSDDLRVEDAPVHPQLTTIFELC